MRNVVVIRVLIFSLFIVGINALTDQENHRHDKLLSRHRRYLTFPEGSSLQLGNGLLGNPIWLALPMLSIETKINNHAYYLVYDQIIGIIDFTNIHIFGVTVSLAWQLPHKTAFADEEHKGMHNNKISISQVDTDKIDKNVPSKDMSKHNYYFESYFNRSNYHSHQMDNDYYAYLNWKKTISKPPSNRQFDDWKTYRSNKTQWDYSHKIYPALRMRRQIAQKKHMNPSQTSSMHPEVHQLVKYHRDSRFSLFKSIEKYLNAYVDDSMNILLNRRYWTIYENDESVTWLQKRGTRWALY